MHGTGVSYPTQKFSFGKSHQIPADQQGKSLCSPFVHMCSHMGSWVVTGKLNLGSSFSTRAQYARLQSVMKNGVPAMPEFIVLWEKRIKPSTFCTGLSIAALSCSRSLPKQMTHEPAECNQLGECVAKQNV